MRQSLVCLLTAILKDACPRFTRRVGGASLAFVALFVAGCDPYYTAIEVRNPNPQAGVWFGHAVASVGNVNGDGAPDFIVGAPYAGIYYQGRAYVFSGRNRSLLHTLDSPIPQENGNFGRAVAGIGDIDGDGVPDIIVGARGEAGYYEEVGRVYLFSGRTGTLIRTIENPEPQMFNQFGEAVASIGDIDDDGVPDVLVGTPSWHAPGPTVGPPCAFFPPNVRCYQGRVYAFSGRLGTLIRAFEHPSPREMTFFGNSVVGARDLDGDGWPDMVAAAPNQTIGNLNMTGEVYVINGRTGALIRNLPSPKPQPLGMFGYALAMRDGNNNPAVPDILAGARNETFAADYQGRAYLFRGADGTLLRQLDRPTAQFRAHFGNAVANAGDLDGDGISDLLIGSPGEYLFNNPSPQGTAFVFDGATGGLLRELPQPNPQPTSAFGRAVAGIGDVNRDGKPDFLIGAPYWHRDADTQFEGVAYVFVSRRPWWCGWLPWVCAVHAGPAIDS